MLTSNGKTVNIKFWLAIFCACAYILFVPSSVFGQEVASLHYSIENGLPSNTIFSIYKDHLGYLWIATDKGVVRYNGVEFEKFTTKDGLPDNEVYKFEEDIYNRLWIITHSGELCYYEDGVFFNGGNTPFLRLNFNHLFAETIETTNDSSVTIWFKDHLHFLNIKKNKVAIYNSRSSLDMPLTEQCCMIRIANDRYLTVCQFHSFVIDTFGNVLKKTANKNRDRYIYRYAYDQKYLISPTGVFDLNEQLLFKFGDSLSKLSVYTALKFGNDWFVCTNDGLFIGNNIHLLRNEKISSIAQDVDGNFWLGTLKNGLFCISKNFKSIRKIQMGDGMQVKYARTVDDVLYFFTEKNCLYKYQNSKLTTVFCHNESKLINNSTRTSLISDNSANYISQDHRFFHLDYRYCYDVLDINSPHPKLVPTTYNFENPVYTGLNPNFKETIEVNGKFFVRNNYYISFFNSTNSTGGQKRLMKLLNDPEQDKLIYCMASDKEQSVWYSRSDSVFYFKNGTCRGQKQFRNRVFQDMLFLGDYLVAVTSKNELIICTNYAGDKPLYGLIVDTAAAIWNRLYRINDSNALISTENNYRILTVHCSTAKPIYELKIVENNFIPLQCEYICVDKDFSYFFRDGAITKVENNSLSPTHTSPTTIFRLIRTKERNYTILDGLVIGYDEAKNINISFSPFSFGSRQPLYEYSVSKDGTEYWRPLRNNEINLFNAGYGNYTVKVRARSLSTSFGTPSVFHFSISKPFWARWWFISLVGAFIGLLVVFLISRNKKRLEKEKMQLQKEVSTLRLQMNPHFLFNTLNSIYSLAKSNSQRTPEMVEQLADMLRYLTYKSTQSLSAISEEIEIVEHYIALQTVRFEDRVEIKKMASIDQPEAKVVPLLLLPLIENAFKHGVGAEGDRSFINIEIILENRLLTVRVNNSIAHDSMKKSNEGGVGLVNIQKQLSLLYRDYKLEYGIKADIFQVELKINLDSYAQAKLFNRRR